MTNKYMLPLLKIVSVTSTKLTFLVRFAFLKSKKEDNVTWALEVCQTMLKDQENMSKVIVTNHYIALMNSFAYMFSTSYALLCRYHIIKKI